MAPQAMTLSQAFLHSIAIGASTLTVIHWATIEALLDSYWGRQTAIEILGNCTFGGIVALLAFNIFGIDILRQYWGWRAPYDKRNVELREADESMIETFIIVTFLVSVPLIAEFKVCIYLNVGGDDPRTFWSHFKFSLYRSLAFVLLASFRNRVREIHEGSRYVLPSGEMGDGGNTPDAGSDITIDLFD